MIKISKYIQYALETEKNLLIVRKAQVKATEQRITLFKAGMDYETVLKKVPPIKSKIKFDKERYEELKREIDVKVKES